MLFKCNHRWTIYIYIFFKFIFISNTTDYHPTAMIKLSFWQKEVCEIKISKNRNYNFYGITNKTQKYAHHRFSTVDNYGGVVQTPPLISKLLDMNTSQACLFSYLQKLFLDIINCNPVNKIKFWQNYPLCLKYLHHALFKITFF